MSDKVDLEYQGKHYYRLADLAKDYNISTSLISSRWHSGHRDPAKLVKKGALMKCLVCIIKKCFTKQKS